MLRVIFVLLLINFLPADLLADTIYLKNGRVVQVDRVWQKGNAIYYSKYGVTVGHEMSEINRVEGDGESRGMKFDVWELGISIYAAIEVAERNDLPLHRENLISANKRFNPKMCRPYANTHSKFYYNTKFLDRTTKIHLIFDSSSRRLAQIHVDVFDTPGTPHKESYRLVYTMLVEQHGEPETSKRNILNRKIKQWDLGAGKIRLLEYGNMERIEYSGNDL